MEEGGREVIIINLLMLAHSPKESYKMDENGRPTGHP